MNVPVIVSILILYMVGMLYIGQRGKKHASNMTDFLTTGKTGRLYMVAGSYLGGHVGTGIVIGGATNGATYGIGAAWYGIGAALSFILFGLFCAKWAYRNKYLTVPAFFRARYKNTGRTMTIAWALLGSAVAITTVAGQIIAGRQLFTYINVDPLIGCIISVIVIYIYCMASGMWGVMMTDFWQCLIIFVGLVSAIAIIFGLRGGGEALASLPATHYNPVPFDFATLSLMVFPTAIYGLTAGASMQLTASANSEKTAIRGALIGGVLTALFTFIPVLIGMYGMGAYPDAQASTVIFRVITTELPSVVAGLVLAAIIAAVMSTVDTTIMTIITSLVYDAYGNVLAPKYGWNRGDKVLRKYANYVTIGIIVGALLLSFQFNNIISVLASGYSLFVSGGMVPYLGARLWSKGTGTGALCSMVTGIFFAILNLAGILVVPTSLVCMIPAAIVYVIVSLFTQKDNLDSGEAAVDVLEVAQQSAQ